MLSLRELRHASLGEAARSSAKGNESHGFVVSPSPEDPALPNLEFILTHGKKMVEEFGSN